MNKIIIVYNSHLLFVFISFCIFSLAWPSRVCASDTSVSSVSSRLPIIPSSSSLSYASCCRISSPIPLAMLSRRSTPSAKISNDWSCFFIYSCISARIALSYRLQRLIVLYHRVVRVITSTHRRTGGFARCKHLCVVCAVCSAYFALVCFDLLKNTRRTHEVGHALQLLWMMRWKWQCTARLLLIKLRRDFSSR